MKWFVVHLAALLFCSSITAAQTRCPAFEAASAIEKASFELQRAAFSAHREAGNIAGDDPWFDMTYAALREAGIHSDYLLSLYLVFPDIEEGKAKVWLRGTIFPDFGKGIVSTLSGVDTALPRVRNPAIRVMLQRGIELRLSLGRDFSQCRLP
jgi:hypothetical protein